MDSNQASRIEAARLLVAAPMIVALADNIEARNPALAIRIRKSLAPMWSHIGEITISDAVLHPYVLHLCTSKVPSGYRFELAIPAGYEGDLRDKFTMFRAAAHAFWAEWISNNSLIVADGNLPTRLTTTETAIRWSASDRFWVGIVGYFTDSQGNKYKANEPALATAPATALATAPASTTTASQ